MIRHVSAVVIVLCLNTVSLSAQTTRAQSTELTVKTASANVHKFASIGSPVIGKVQRGTVLEITRNLGSWVEVPWPAGEGGIAFLHVNAGSIGHRSAPDSNGFAPTPTPAPPAPASAAIASSVARGEQQIAAAGQPGSRRPVYISLPSHIFGLGGRMSASTPGFGATARTWWGNRLGFQFDASRYLLDSVAAPGHLTSIQFAPSVLYSLPDGVSDSLWVRPYLGAGGSLYRATLSGGTSSLTTDKGLGFQAFGGGEATFSGVPRFALSADIGYRWSRTSFVGFEPRKIGFSLSAHWYVK